MLLFGELGVVPGWVIPANGTTGDDTLIGSISDESELKFQSSSLSCVPFSGFGESSSCCTLRFLRLCGGDGDVSPAFLVLVGLFASPRVDTCLMLITELT